MSTLLPSSLHQRLRQTTREAHRVLDHHPLMARLLAEEVSVRDYGNALAALHGMYAVTEAALLAYLEAHPGRFEYASRRKLAALDEDLHALGRSPVAPGDGGPACPAIDSIGALIGTLYTLEGATLGGQFIARRLQHTCTVRLPLAFYTIYGTEVEQRWEAFLAYAQQACTADDIDTAATSALALFEALSRHLDQAHSLLADGSRKLPP